MKKFNDLLQGILESTAFQDPPVMLVLRRKAIRMFPGGQSIAQYRNDNLNIDVAIPYTPGQLGKKHQNVATSESINEVLKVKNHEFKAGETVHMDGNSVDHSYTGSGHVKIVNPHSNSHEVTHVDKSGREYSNGHRHIRTATVERPERKTLSGTILPKKHFDVHHFYLKKISEEVITEKKEPMSPELKKMRMDRIKFKRDVVRQKDSLDIARERLDWAKRILAGHIKKYGKTLNPLREGTETVDELSTKALSSYVRGAASHMTDLNDKMNKTSSAKKFRDLEKKYYKRGVGVNKAIDKIQARNKDTIMEATIHALHAINKTKTPAQVRFRDGSVAMIDHPTASQVMHLYSKLNSKNKKKIKGLIDSGVSGIRKISKFYSDHVKKAA